MLLGGRVTAQTQPDFSGHWVLVNPGTGAGQPASSRASRSPQTDIRGGAINCVNECTIVQKADTLSISRPAGQDGVAAKDVVLSLDGHQSSFNASVKWDGATLVVIRSIAMSAVTQILSLQDGKLRVVSAFGAGGPEPVTLMYERRPDSL